MGDQTGEVLAARKSDNTEWQIPFENYVPSSTPAAPQSVLPSGTITRQFQASDAASSASLRRAYGQLPPEAPETPEKKQSWFEWFGQFWNSLWS
jgi:hypothetical protein